MTAQTISFSQAIFVRKVFGATFFQKGSEDLNENLTLHSIFLKRTHSNVVSGEILVGFASDCNSVLAVLEHNYGRTGKTIVV